jgi:hypothetical protein
MLRQRDAPPPEPQAAEQPSDLLGTASRAGFYGGEKPLTAARAGTFAQQDAAPTHVLQIAPPTKAATATTSLVESDDGGIRLGARDLRARAVLSEANSCEDAMAESAASIRTDSVFTGPGGQTVRMPAGGRTSTATGLLAGAGGYSALALATATVPDLEIRNGATVRVTAGPALRITASGDPGTSTVTFTAPRISVSTPQAPTTFHELAGPVDLSATEDPDQIDAVLRLLRTLGGNGPTESPLDQVSRALLVRLAPGGVVEQNRGWVVHALASALHVTMLLREVSTTGTVIETELAEISVGCVETLAYAPVGGYPRLESSPPPVDAGEAPDSAGGSADREPDTDVITAGGVPLEPVATVTSPDETESTTAAARPTIPPAPTPPSRGHSVTMNSTPGRTSLAGCLVALAIGACGMYGLWRRRMGRFRL